MKKYVIERGVPGIGSNDQKGLSAIAHQSNGALAKLRSRIQWQEELRHWRQDLLHISCRRRSRDPRACAALRFSRQCHH